MNTHANTLSHEENIREIWALFRETREQFRETREQFRETGERFDKVIRENDRRYEKTAKQFRETDKKIDKITGRFDTRWGRLLEALTEDGVLEIFKHKGIKVRQVHPRVKARLKGRTMEVDLLLTNDIEIEIVVVEVKTTLKADHVKDFLKRMDDFTIFFPVYKKKYKIYGAVAGLSMEQSSAQYAAKQGLFVIKVGGEGLVRLLNDDAFLARDFGCDL